MSDYTLTAGSPLGGYQESFDGVELAEAADLAIVSIAVPLGGAEALATALDQAYGAGLAAPGGSTASPDGAVRFLGLAQDQMFAIFSHDGADAANLVADKLGQAGYTTLQSDNWVVLRLSGPRVREALERICPLDLAPSAFPPGRVARTVMEHLGVIILAEDKDSFLLLSASSSAASFRDTVAVSARNIA